ncbi:alanine racemase [Mangrovibacillus cuniculi]|uniref:Alanine racemase n=1 Tax=Mangrovibacillus cuniculi TaxID=2593652 RepID=A0A7S8HGV3_9BACI|nr:alanine racemase [Mangrovibacillus cuniculi]QPC48187.1 alanine racemase [Mangrovibacillus cuniculi]
MEQKNNLFYRDTWVDIDLTQIEQNIISIKNTLPKGKEIFAVVKANGYGHGAVEVAESAIRSGVGGLAVAFIDEALVLRNGGITHPILVLGASRPQDVPLAQKNKLTLTVFRQDWLVEAEGWLDSSIPVKVHVKIDTGMARLGVRTMEEFLAMTDWIESHKGIELDGVFTHFAKADEDDQSFMLEQRDKFVQYVEALPKKPKYIHHSNSGATIKIPDDPTNMVRVGIAMYGLLPSEEMKNEMPAGVAESFSLHSRLIHVKKVEAGEPVSYGSTYHTKEAAWIGTIPIGYADGWLRRLQGADVLVGGVRCEIVGRICMDQCMILLPTEYPLGTQVTLVGKQGTEQISMGEVAAKSETIQYEIPCIISSRVPRRYFREGKDTKVINPLLK